MDKPNYYAVITAEVRYDKDISPGAKLLYAEITSLSNKQGYCWALNGYFSDLYGVKDWTISNWLRQLKKKGYIFTKNNNEKRVIYLFCNEKNHSLLGEKSNSCNEKNHIHNTKENIKNNITQKEAEKLFESFYELYPKKKSPKGAKTKYVKILRDCKTEKEARDLAAIILKAVADQKLEREKKLEKIKNTGARIFIPEWKHPTTWLNNECWEEEVELEKKEKSDFKLGRKTLL